MKINMNEVNLTELFELVKEEALKLKEVITKEEIANLDFVTLRNTPEACVYGQMTGDCSSSRALDLINSCCNRVYDNIRTEGALRLNGSPKGKTRGEFVVLFFSPIETMLAYVDAMQTDAFTKLTPVENTINLIKYLKGELDNLVLTEEGMLISQEA